MNEYDEYIMRELAKGHIEIYGKDTATDFAEWARQIHHDLEGVEDRDKEWFENTSPEIVQAICTLGQSNYLRNYIWAMPTSADLDHIVQHVVANWMRPEDADPRILWGDLEFPNLTRFVERLYPEDFPMIGVEN